MSHPLVHLTRRRQLKGYFGAEGDGIPEQIADAVVEATMPAIKARIPEVAQQFVDAAVPRVQQRLVDLEPQLQDLAVSSAQAVLSDPQIQDTIKAAVADQAQKARAEIRKGFLLTVLAVLSGTLLIEIAEPYLPGRRRSG